MALRGNKHIPLDTANVDINDPDELKYWCDHFSCNRDQLREAISKVGTSAEGIKNYLKY